MMIKDTLYFFKAALLEFLFLQYYML